MPAEDCEIALVKAAEADWFLIRSAAEKGHRMKKQVVLGATLVLLGLLALPAFGQGPSIKVNVPFGFTLGDKTYPAGEYAFSAMKENLVLLDKDGSQRLGMFLANHLAGQNNTSEARFQCYDKLCFLSQVWIPGIDGGFQPLRSRSEIEVAQRVTGKYVALLGTSPRQ
jgi:hypothetical protein